MTTDECPTCKGRGHYPVLVQHDHAASTYDSRWCDCPIGVRERAVFERQFGECREALAAHPCGLCSHPMRQRGSWWVCDACADLQRACDAIVVDVGPGYGFYEQGMNIRLRDELPPKIEFYTDRVTRWAPWPLAVRLHRSADGFVLYVRVLHWIFGVCRIAGTDAGRIVSVDPKARVVTIDDARPSEVR